MLDFGCGHGYVAMLVATLPQQNTRVYACDSNEECLDVLWGRIAHRLVHNLTAFHMSNYSQIYLPGWLPAPDYVICSFSISALEHPEIGLPQLVKQLPVGVNFLFVEWDPEKTHKLIDIYAPAARRIAAPEFRQLLEYSGLKITHDETGKHLHYVMRAVKE